MEIKTKALFRAFKILELKIIYHNLSQLGPIINLNFSRDNTRGVFAAAQGFQQH